MKRKTILAFIIPAIFVCLAAVVLCAVFIPKENKASMTLVADDVTIVCGESKEINYYCSDEDAEISFESYNEKIVSIVGNVMTANKVGSTSIRVKAKSADTTIYSSFKVTVIENASQPLTSLPSEITLYLIDKNFDAAKADGFNNQITFVKNRTIASITTCKQVKISGNTITASKLGSGEIVFKAPEGESGNQVVKVNVLVVEARLASVPSTITMNPKDRTKIDYQILPSYYTGDAVVKFKASGDCVNVEDGCINAKSSGEGSVSVSLGEQTLTIDVKVVTQIKFVLTAVDNCTIDGNNIYVSSNAEACFMLELYTLDNQNIAFSSVEISTDGVEIEREVNNVNFSSVNGGVIVIYSPSLLSYVYFYVHVC